MKKFSTHHSTSMERRFNKVIVVMPAYNAEHTLENTFREIPLGYVSELILIDDGSSDRTVDTARQLGIAVILHGNNRGYGAAQKTCYDAALKRGAEVVVMVHPDYQYDSRVIPYVLGFLKTGICDIVLGSRIRTRREALEGGMPLYKYIGNRFLTIIENIVLGQNLGDFHSGFRAYTRQVLEKIPYQYNSNDFVFDTEFLVQAAFFNFRIGDIPIPTRYFDDSSSIDFFRSIQYAFQSLWVIAKYLLQKARIYNFKLFCVPPARDKRTPSPHTKEG